MNAISPASVRPVTLADLGREPFRILFPAGVVAGITGVALWPLHFLGVVGGYPGLNHARIMADGLFGAFIFGFLGTALPRLLSVPPLHYWQTFILLGLHLALLVAFATAHIFAGDLLFLGWLLVMVGCLAARIPRRQDLPPPGFVLVVLAFGCAGVGAVLAVVEQLTEIDPWWVLLQRLLSYQGFVLLPILGIGPFLLPRFLGTVSTHALPESRVPSRVWKQKACLAAGAGALVITSFILEARGYHRPAHALRLVVTVAYLLVELPLGGVPCSDASGLCLRFALATLCAGFLAVVLFPAFRVGLLHLTLIGGFAVLMFVVATRVVFGHGGCLARLKQRNLWMFVSVGLMFLGMATRISGDFLPRILSSHYSYGAAWWILGVLIWSVVVLPQILRVDAEP